MKYEQYQRADEIAEQLKELYRRQAELKGISEGKICEIQISCMRRNDGSYPSYRLENLAKVENQPELVKIFIQAAVLSIASAYDREIKRLENEFESL